MKYQLTIINKKELSLYPIEKKQTVIGRSSKTDLKIKDRYVSRKHIVIKPSDNEQYVLNDFGTKNSTFLNGELIKANYSYCLKEDDEIKIGETLLRFNSVNPVRNDDKISRLNNSIKHSFSNKNISNRVNPDTESKKSNKAWCLKPVFVNNKSSLPVGIGALPSYYQLSYGSGNIDSTIGSITSAIPYVYYTHALPKEIKQVIKWLFTSSSFWWISLLVHLTVLGAMVFVYHPKNSDIKTNSFGVTLFAERSGVPIPIGSDTYESQVVDKLRIDSTLKSLFTNTKIIDNNFPQEEKEFDFVEESETGFQSDTTKSQNEISIESGEGNGLSSKELSQSGGQIGLGMRYIGGKGKGLSKQKESLGIGNIGGKTASLTNAVLLTGNRSGTNGAKILSLKWEYRFLTTMGVRLNQPSGWGHGDPSVQTAPWLISSPAIMPEDNSLSIISGTEEGSGEFNPSNANARSTGRYVCVSNTGKSKWEYHTDNNAGRASPLVFDYLNNTEILGGSTSGWMVHLFKKLGARIWRFESEGKANFIASPSLAELDSTKNGPEIFALDLNGQLYCLSHYGYGHKIWSKQVSDHPAIATPLIYDVDNDGNLEIITAGGKLNPSAPSSIIHCLDGKTGEIKWVREIPRETNSSGWYFQVSSPAIIPKPNETKITIGVGNKLYALDGQTGKVAWAVATNGYIYSSPAVGDCDGDKKLEVIVGSLDANIYCVDSETGKNKWIYKTKGQVYSSPALATQNRVAPFQVEWSMFRNSKQRTGYYENSFTKGLDIIIGSDDGSLYLIDGKDGHLISQIPVNFPELTVAGSKHGPLKFISSPIVADIDGDRKLEIIFTLVDRMVCITDNRR